MFTQTGLWRKLAYMKDDLPLQNVASVPEFLDLAKLQAQMQRPAKNVNMDGSFELGWAMGILCLSLTPYLNAILPKSAWTSWWTAWIGYLPLICGAFAPYAIPKIIKRFITWPRTGYVANPNEVTLIQLVMLMGFGLVLGYCLVTPFLLVSEIREALRASSSWQGIIWHGIKLLVCATLAVYLGHKTIRKRQPLPAACDAALLNSGLNQTVAGKQCLRQVKFTLLLLFLGIPLLVGAVVFGLMYLGKSAIHQAELSWPQLAMLGFLVGTNAILYAMANGATIKQYRWKWLMLAFLLIGPIILAPLIPYPAVQPDFASVLAPLPPVILSLGLVWFCSGMITLAVFIRHNPLPSPENP